MRQAAAPDAARRHPELSRPWTVFALLAVIQFVVVLDASVVYIALPSIRADLGFSLVDLAWVMDAYMLGFGGFMLLGGRAADLLGRRRVLHLGLVAFGLASLSCALATESWQLVAARAGQGLAAAFVSPAALALVTDTFPEGPDRYKALGLFGGIGGVAGATGVLLGGLLTAIGWPWAFLVNVPIVVAVLVLGHRRLPVNRPTAVGGVDLPGSLVGTAGLCLLLYAVLHGSGQGWTSSSTLAAAVAGAILVAGFVVRQSRAAAPLIPRALLRMRHVVSGNIVNLMTGAVMFGTFFILTLYLQLARGYSPLRAGAMTVPVSLALFAGSQWFRVLPKVSPADALLAGLVAQGAGLGLWAATLGPVSPIGTTFVLPGLIWGLGVGGAIVAAFVICTSRVPGASQGAASGLVSTTLQVGGALGLAVLSTVAGSRTGAAAERGSDMASALVSGQAWALGVAAAVAFAAVPVVLWIRASWRPHEPLEHTPDEAIAPIA